MITASIQSEGDLEVVVLHEAHSLLAALINPQLYAVHGSRPEQTAQFHDQPCFDLFIILLIELFAEGTQSAYINSKFQNLSLLSALTWLITKYPDEASAAGLDIAITELTNWLNREVPIQFWCADVNSEIQFPLTNRQLISFESNTTKHHLLRLSELIKKLETLCVKAGYNFSSQQLIAILHCMLPEARSRLEYHFTFMLELIGHLFLAINQFIVGRFQRNPTNIAENMVFPTGITSDVFRDLYANILVFKRYDEERIINYTPTTSQMLRLRYQ